MKNLYLFIIVFIFAALLNVQLMNAQSDGAASWTGNGGDALWSNPGNWTTASYPSGASSVVLIGDGAQGNATYPESITLDVDVTLKQLKMGGGVPAAYTAKIIGTNTMTLTGGPQGSAVTNVAQINKVNGVFEFGCKVKIDSPINGVTRNVQLNSTGAVGVVFNENSTLILEDHFGIIFKTGNNSQNYATFAGAIESTLTKDLIIKDFGNATFASTVDMSNYAGDLNTSGGNTSVGTKVDGPVKVRALNLANAHNITINQTGSIEVSSSNVTTPAAASAKIKIIADKDNSGSLIAKNAGNNNETLPTVRFEKITQRLNQDGEREWTLLGIPVTGWTSSDIDNFTAIENGKEAIGYFNNATGLWETWAPDAAEALTPGKGYHASPDNTDDNKIVIQGALVKGFQQTTVTDEDGQYGNWNLIGNPYTSYIRLNDNNVNNNNTGDSTDDEDDFLSENAPNIHNTYEAIYYWDGERYRSAGAGAGKSFIAPGEGFFIYVRDITDGTTPGINFRPSMQAVSKGANFNAAIVNGGENDKNSEFTIKVSDVEKGREDFTNIYFTDKSEKGLDPGYDIGKFPLGDGPKISTKLVEEDQGHSLENQYLPSSDINDLIVPLVISSKSSSLTLSVSQNTISDLVNVFFEDKLNNTIVKFNNTIDIDLGNNLNTDNRFYVHFTDQLIPELPTDDNLRIFKSSDSELVVMGSVEKEYRAKIYDYSGRLIKDVLFNHKTKIRNLDSKLKIMRIESEEGTVIKKFKLD